MSERQRQRLPFGGKSAVVSNGPKYLNLTCKCFQRRYYAFLVLPLSKLHPHSSNFYLADFKTVVELAEDCLLIFDGRQAHGTTLSLPALRSDYLKLMKSKEHMEVAQISYALVLTSQFCSAGDRRF